MKKIKELIRYEWEVSINVGPNSGYWVTLQHSFWGGGERINVYDSALKRAIEIAYSKAKELDLDWKESG